MLSLTDSTRQPQCQCDSVHWPAVRVSRHGSPGADVARTHGRGSLGAKAVRITTLGADSGRRTTGQSCVGQHRRARRNRRANVAATCGVAWTRLISHECGCGFFAGRAAMNSRHRTRAREPVGGISSALAEQRPQGCAREEVKCEDVPSASARSEEPNASTIPESVNQPTHRASGRHSFAFEVARM
jgi:hypothetical protein